MNKIPRPGELYRHYTDKIYQIITIAKHSETDERLVVFQALYGAFDVYASPLSQFISEVDHKKYPRIGQQYWFERIEKAEVGQRAQSLEKLNENIQISQDSYDSSYDSRQRAGLEDSGVQDDCGRGKLYAGLMQDEQQAETFYDRDVAQTETKDKVQSQAELNSVQHQRYEEREHSSWHQIKREREVNRQAERQDGRMDSALSSDAVSRSYVKESEKRPRTQSPADSKRAYREETAASETESGYLQKRRRQLAERENRRGQFRKPQRQESATDELRANPNLLKFLDADTFEEKYQVLNEIQDDVTDRLIDDIAVVLDVVIPEGPLHDRYSQLKNIILTRQKYETSRFR